MNDPQSSPEPVAPTGDDLVRVRVRDFLTTQASDHERWAKHAAEPLRSDHLDLAAAYRRALASHVPAAAPREMGDAEMYQMGWEAGQASIKDADMRAPRMESGQASQAAPSPVREERERVIRTFSGLLEFLAFRRGHTEASCTVDAADIDVALAALRGLPPETAARERLKAIVEFLAGIAPHPDYTELWFGSLPPTGKGTYFWRSDLRAAVEAVLAK